MRRVWLWILIFVSLTAGAAADTEITLTFGGDCVLGTREEWVGTPGNFEECVDQNGMDWCFSGISDLFAEDDFTLVNLECVLQDGNQGHNNRKQHTFRGRTAYARMLSGASVEGVNIANNHYIDYNQSGETSTKAALEAAGVEYCGFRNLFTWERDGVKIGFGGCRETVFYEENNAYIYRDIQKLKDMGCDVVIYSCHWGEEYSPLHSQKQERMAQYAVNSGADIVVGTHPHVVQGVADLDGCAVIYSLGNLVFGGTHELQTFDAILARAVLRFDDDKNYLGADITLIPVLTSGSAPENDFRAVPADGWDKERIFALVQADSELDISGSLWFPKK
jgi:hypothetical protein